MLSRPMPCERHSKSDRAARPADARRSSTPLWSSKDPTAGSPRSEVQPRFHATPRTDHLHAAWRQAAPGSRSDRQDRYGLALAQTAGFRLWRQTAVVDTAAQHFQSLTSLADYVCLWLQPCRQNGLAGHFEPRPGLIRAKRFDQFFHNPLADLLFLELDNERHSNRSAVDKFHNVFGTTRPPCRNDRHPLKTGEACITHQCLDLPWF